MPDAELSQPLPKESLTDRQLLPILVIESSAEAASEQALQEAAKRLGASTQQAARYALKWKLFSGEVV